MTSDHNQFPAVVEGRIGDDLVQTANARDLHAYLRVGKDYSSWIKDRIEQYGFTEGVDFVKYEDLRSPNSGSAKSRAQVVIEYAISIDMAKELSMVERNEQGKKARLHFIECERRAKAGITAADLLANPPQLLAIAQGYALQIEDMKRDMTVMQADVDTLHRISGSDDLFGIRQTAKLVQMPQNKFVEWLQRNRWAYRQLGAKRLLAYAEREKTGYCRNVATTYKKEDGTEGVRDTLKFYPKGVVAIAKKLDVVVTAEAMNAARQEAE